MDGKAECQPDDIQVQSGFSGVRAEFGKYSDMCPVPCSLVLGAGLVKSGEQGWSKVLRLALAARSTANTYCERVGLGQIFTLICQNGQAIRLNQHSLATAPVLEWAANRGSWQC